MSPVSNYNEPRYTSPMPPDSKLRPDPFGNRYNPYSRYLKDRFGCRVYKVIVDGGFTCPNRDGTVAVGGCTYCDNESFRPASVRRRQPLQEQVARGIAYLGKRYRARKFIVYFQPFTNTHAPLERLVPKYEAALAHPDVVGLAIGTRPDCVDDAKVAWFEHLARSRLVSLEYGLESIQNATLERINRGHDFQCWVDAVRRTKDRGIDICGHVILGFPWETRDQVLATADAVSDAGIDSIKLHHLHIVEHTALGREYRRAPFPLLECDEYLELAVDFLERLAPRIRVERLFGLAPEDRLIAPKWGKTKAELQYAIEQRLAARDTFQGRLWKQP